MDLRGAGRDVARKMGLERTLRAHATREEGIRFVDAANRTKAAFTSGAFGGQGPIADLEILRADLSRILFEATHPHAEYLFGDEITQPSDTGKGADGAFRNGPGRAFDLVVAADGARSRTRDLIFGDTTDIRPVGLTTAYFTTPPPALGRHLGPLAQRHWGTHGHPAPRHRGTTRAPCPTSPRLAEMNAWHPTHRSNSCAVCSPALAGRFLASSPAWTPPTTSSSTPSPRSACPPGPGVASLSSATPRTAPHLPAAWAPASPSPAPTFWPANSPTTRITATRSPATSTSSAPTSPAPSICRPACPASPHPAPGLAFTPSTRSCAPHRKSPHPLPRFPRALPGRGGRRAALPAARLRGDPRGRRGDGCGGRRPAASGQQRGPGGPGAGNAETIPVVILAAVTSFVTAELLPRGPSGTKRRPREEARAAG